MKTFTFKDSPTIYIMKLKNDAPYLIDTTNNKLVDHRIYGINSRTPFIKISRGKTYKLYLEEDMIVELRRLYKEQED